MRAKLLPLVGVLKLLRPHALLARVILILPLFVLPAPATSQSPVPVPRPSRVAEGSVPAPVFTDPERVAKLRAALPEIERLFEAWVESQRFPGAALAVLIDGEPVLVRTIGVQDVSTRAPVTADTRFRIASMTKSFTALAVLRLRDEGRLSLDDPVARWVPELGELEYPTSDAPVLTIRHLLTHSEGFPEDNPWGDRQLAQPDTLVGRWLREGIPFSNVPGLRYEYSNFGFAILGRVIERAAGMPYADYLEQAILEPLGMHASTLSAGAIPNEARARGYRYEGGRYLEEAALEHGAFGAMGGLWTTIGDLGKYVAWHMDAWPPRDEPERGPVRRASVREMQQPWRSQPAFALRSAVDQPLALAANAYGFGLRMTQTCDVLHVGHGGGLPGWGSLMRWLPEYGVGLIALANLTYAPFAGFFDQATSVFQRTGALKPRVPQPGPELITARRDVERLVLNWSDSLAHRIAAHNLFLDESLESRRAQLASLRERVGPCRQSEGNIDAQNALRGSWRMPCERGWLELAITLAPTRPARVQYLTVRAVLPPGELMQHALTEIALLAESWNQAHAAALASPASLNQAHAAALAPPASLNQAHAAALAPPGLDLARLERQLALVRLLWGPCTAGDVLAGDGVRETTVRWTCARGLLDVTARLEAASGRLEQLAIVPAREQSCAQ